MNQCLRSTRIAELSGRIAATERNIHEPHNVEHIRNAVAINISRHRIKQINFKNRFI